MAILNFPDTTGQPTDGSFTYTENDITYVWDGVKWTAQGGTGGGGGLWEQNGDDIFYNNGNVGVGTNAPKQALDVVGQVNLPEGNAVIWDDGTAGATQRARIFGNANSELVFTTGSGGTRRATIDSAGRLLVGTPGSASVNCYIQALGNPANDAGAEFYLGRREAATKPFAAGNSLGSIQFGDNAGSTFAHVRSEVDGTSGSASFPGRLSFATTPSGATDPVERMRIREDGLIGTFGTQEGLYHFINGAADAGQNFIVCAHSATGVLTGGTVSFRVRTTGDVQNTTGNQIAPIGSERRIKDKIGSFDPTEAWNVVKNATPRPYELKEMPGTQCYGYIVDELPEDLVLPGTTEDEEGPIRTYDSNKLAFMYRVALKEALGRIEQLEAIVVELSKKVV